VQEEKRIVFAKKKRVTDASARSAREIEREKKKEGQAFFVSDFASSGGLHGKLHF
jgi:hypothetical protein